jgi:hypothetical protein
MIVVAACGRSPSRSRRGITLTEILIAILILGIGLISLATLFPIGLLRLRDATRYSRSAFLSESAVSDIAARGLLKSSSFAYADQFNIVNGFPTWYSILSGNNANLSYPFFWSPLTQDAGFYGDDPRDPNNPGASNNNSMGNGLPFAYDPLWRAQVINPNTNLPGYYLDPIKLTTFEARFGSGIGFIRLDPSDQGVPSAHGLQRLTNFNGQLISVLIAGTPTLVPMMPTAVNVPYIFVSQEDVVWQDPTNNNYTLAFNPTLAVGTPSPVVPDLSISKIPNANGGFTQTYQQTNDFRYTWMFTGYQTNSGSASTFEGSIVIFENRPFGITPVANAPYSTGLLPQAYQVDGETVVEAVYGYSNNVQVDTIDGYTIGYGAGADRTVLLRWPNVLPDPVVKAGDWIADVTYERQQNVVFNQNATPPTGRFQNLPGQPAGAAPNGLGIANPNNSFEWDNLPAQRCIWYQVQKVTPAADVVAGSSLDFGGTAFGYRYMFVYVNSSLQSKTVLNSSGQPVVLNAALIAPNVINVIPQTFYLP